MDPRLALTRSLVRRNPRRRARSIATSTQPPPEEVAWLTCKTRASCRRGSTRRIWLGRDRMARARMVFHLFTRTTTTSAVPEDGRHFYSFTYFVGLAQICCLSTSMRQRRTAFGIRQHCIGISTSARALCCPALMNDQP